MDHSKNLLAFDASSSQCSVALMIQNRVLVRRSETARQAAQLLLPMTKELLLEADLTLSQLDGIAVAAGPGSFTGLRIGIGVAQGLSMAANLPVIALSNLAVLSYSAITENQVDAAIACCEARDNEVYFAAYQSHASLGVELIGAEQVAALAKLDVASLRNLNRNCWAAAGDGWSSGQEIEDLLGIQAVQGRLENDLNIHDLCTLASLHLVAGKGLSPEQVQPNYIKEQLDYS